MKIFLASLNKKVGLRLVPAWWK